jgi:SAM-dependent methyltransferase
VSGLDNLYTTRFDERSRLGKVGVWRELVRFLRPYIAADQPALDVGCDAGYFIRHVEATERWGSDIRDVGGLLPDDVRFCQVDGLSLASAVPADYFGTILMSNYLEHLPSPDAVMEQFRVVARLLAQGGHLIVLQPNIRFLGGSYWDFLDHRVPLTDRSLVEAGESAGLRTERLIPRFMPYTTKGRLPLHPRLVRLYLAFPPAWFVLGKQTLYVGQRER